jgi:hypothetical protein
MNPGIAGAILFPYPGILLLLPLPLLLPPPPPMVPQNCIDSTDIGGSDGKGADRELFFPRAVERLLDDPADAEATAAAAAAADARATVLA